MAFWWVNHKQSWKAETGRGILWAPLTKADGREYQPYLNMRLARKGDVVFSYAGTRIGHVGVVDTEAVPSSKPDYALKAPWANEGLLLPVTFSALPRPISPKEHITAIAPLLPKTHAPIRADGNGNLSYLSSISEELGTLILKVGGIEINSLPAESDGDSLSTDLLGIALDESLRPTEKRQLTKARIGQGVFRKSVLALEPTCRVTGVSTTSLLRASHIKPWSEASNEERLDGANGLMLAPHIDLLFDRHLLTFTDSGELVISRNVSVDLVQKWHLDHPLDKRPLTLAQRRYMKIHRERLDQKQC